MVFSSSRQIRSRDQVLMHADRAIDLAAAAEQVAERQMRLDRVAVEFGELQEHLDRLVRLLVQQVIQAAEVARRQLADAARGASVRCRGGRGPAGQRGDRQQQRDERRKSARAASGVAHRRR